jgi:hypothetical protein
MKNLSMQLQILKRIMKAYKMRKDILGKTWKRMMMILTVIMNLMKVGDSC